MKYNCIFVVGPTGSGKSAVALQIASKFNGEIINSDSMQIYKEYNIGTAKPTQSEMQIVKHHLYNIVSVKDEFSVSEYKELAINKFNEIKNNCLPIFVGGTGLYFTSLINDYNFATTDKDESLREELNLLATKMGNNYIHKMLEELDPEEAKKIPPENLKRVIRAIEICKLTGKSKTELLKENKNQQTNKNNILKPLIIGITWNRDELYQRINKRVDIMLNNGLLNEAKNVFEHKDEYSNQFVLAIGYKEFFEYFNNEKTLENCTELLKQKSRNYAKRQLTWFNKMENVNWFNLSHQKIEDVLDFICNNINK